jgi:hypothetical protein
MDSFGSPLQFTFAAATQQAIDLVSANRLTIGTSDEWVLASAWQGTSLHYICRSQSLTGDS